ncbi:MAG: DUF4340 domain-containing protein [Candidatus Electrothrix scaldis]|nr:MAG: DUF4340 domain-containing protein [Candidatus Electrothrix sp. GW3-3]
MIKAIIYAAAVLLIFQIGLTVAVHQQQAVNLESTAPDSAFLSFTPGSISSIIINGPEKKELVLQKGDKGWIMPGAFSAPASQRQVDDLLQKLADAHQGLAVATSKGAAKRFKTAEDDFERHVVLKQGDTVAADFYLGTSAGVRNSHVRKAGQDAVVSIPVGSHEVDVDADSWLDRSLANLSKDELKAVTLGDISLTKKKEDKESIWTLEGASKEETNKDEVDSLLSKITALSVQSVLDPVKSAELLSKAPAVEFTVTKEDDSKLTYAFAKNDDEKDEYFILKMSNNDLYFKVGKWLVEGLTEAKREKLLVGYEEPKEETPAAAEQGAPALDLPAPEVEQAVLPELPEEDASDQTDQAVQEELSEQGEQDGDVLAEPEPAEDAVAPAAEEAETADEAAPVEQETEDSQEEEAAPAE